MIITTGSANFEEKTKQNKKQNQNKKNLSAVFLLNEECPKLLSCLGIDHRRRMTIPLWNSSGGGGGGMSSSGHHCMSGIYNIGHCVMPW